MKVPNYAGGISILSTAMFLAGAALIIPAQAADSSPTNASLNLVGVVSTLTGTPITNASIFIFTAGPRQGAGVVCPGCYADCQKSTKSDSAGKFLIGSVSPTLVFQVLVVAPGFAPTFFNKVDPLNGPLAAKLDTRVTTNIPPSQIIFGRVTNTNKEPLVNAVVSVNVTTIGNTMWGYPPKGVDPLAITDTNGEFAISSLVKFDSMNLEVEARGYARQIFPQIRPGSKPLECVLTEGAALTGQVLLNGKPMKNISVGAAALDRRPESWVGPFTFGTDENGRFLFVNLPPNRDYAFYGLTDSLQKFGTLPVRTVHVKGDGSVTDLGTLEIVPGHRLAGRVELSNGWPIPPHTHLYIGRDPAWDTSAACDIELPADGHFDFTNVPAETISISTSVNGFRFSGLNASLNRLNPFGLVGQLDSDKTNLIVLLEVGTPFETDYNAESREKLPLAGAEKFIPKN
jgi:hypothetical protein